MGILKHQNAVHVAGTHCFLSLLRRGIVKLRCVVRSSPSVSRAGAMRAPVGYQHGRSAWWGLWKVRSACVLDSSPIPRVSSTNNNDKCTAWDDVLDERSCFHDVAANGLGAGVEESLRAFGADARSMQQQARAKASASVRASVRARARGANENECG